ncbi:transcriptional regulator, ArsR family [Aeromicrobium marinum DSM 15272]|uniref:Transcriptional regulator, ArsR family n=1 Tax=Aeromicrobium marinum DSM 15272 TaxID=585531 RepID=E2S8C9_9ACTN|nr:metalloregulator ArsR/SmtB family transcription factor [Aeromicrobium marinum]EFQ84434.1 transcriptional regulator, ArsR family [Aeromicrobium marinum DSM 15272]
MTAPAHRVQPSPVVLPDPTATLFRTLGHPVRIRVLELLQDGPRQVRDLLAVLGTSSSNLSQQLAVLRRAGLVTSSRAGGTVSYRLSTPEVGHLLEAAAGLSPLLQEDIAGAADSDA